MVNVILYSGEDQKNLFAVQSAYSVLLKLTLLEGQSAEKLRIAMHVSSLSIYVSQELSTIVLA